MNHSSKSRIDQIIFLIAAMLENVGIIASENRFYGAQKALRHIQLILSEVKQNPI